MRRSLPFRHSRRLLGLLLAALLGSGSSKAQEHQALEEETVSAARRELRVCLDQALQARAQLEVLGAQTAAARAQEGSPWRYGPMLQVQGGVALWDDAYAVDVAVGPGAAVSFPVREQLTGSADVVIAQPLTGIYQASIETEAGRLGVEAAERRQEQGAQTIGWQVVLAFVDAAIAEAMAGVAEEAVGVAEQRRRDVQALLAAQLATPADVAQVAAACAQADAQAMAARGAIEMTQVMLGRQVGAAGERWHPGELPEWLQRDPWSQGTEPSPEHPVLRLLQSQRALAEVQVRALRAARLPTVNLVASGQARAGSEFQPTLAFFAGATLSWTAWDGGRAVSRQNAAEAQVQAALAGFDEAEAGLRAGLAAAAAAGRTAVAQAEQHAEAERAAELSYRSLLALRRQALATEADVLGAQLGWRLARANAHRARFEVVRARVRFLQLRGDDPFALAGIER